jgi:hypothetical protein
MVREVLLEEGPMPAEELASRLASRGDAFAVLAPEAVEVREEDGGEVTVLRGGSRRALSPSALEGRIRRRMNGIERRPDGSWEAMPEHEVAGAFLGGDA